MSCIDLKHISLEPKQIVKDVYWVGVNDCVKDLFESLWPIPSGISYNAYVVEGSEGAAVIDGVDRHLTYEYIEKIREVVGDLDRVKYVVINHLEPDHHASTPALLSLARNARIVISPVGAKIIQSLYQVPRDRIVEVLDGGVLNLGGKTLKFIFTPWIHWPETMMTYLEEEGVLFSCDAFGSYGALAGGIFDDEVDLEYYLEEARRYFSNIVLKYSRNVSEAISKIEKLGLKISVIAPSHGPIYRRHIDKIFSLYRDLYQPKLRVKASIIYGSMYGRTEEIVERVAEALRKKDVTVELIDAARVHPSYVLHYVVDSGAIVFIYPTYDAAVFPPVLDIANYLHIKQVGRGRVAAVLNTSSWGPAIREIVDLLNKSGFQVLDAVSIKAIPTPEDEKRIEELIEKLAMELKKLT
ncbi:MAG: FprA family A-type flavoprotein [Sulfolobales archaeon]|nr:FprA family A-type flavoprotein [Sulfolobales archaeon]MDW8082284.1 FprA family A-type flavoprotein [Sulfolobales archaeon]